MGAYLSAIGFGGRRKTAGANTDRSVVASRIGEHTDEQQVDWVTFAMLGVLGAWLAVVAYLAHRAGYPRGATAMSLPAWSYIGYPVWAFWLGRHLLSARPALPRA